MIFYENFANFELKKEQKSLKNTISEKNQQRKSI